MTNDNNLCVFDFETNGLDIDTCEPVELACVILDPFKLQVIPGSQFTSLMRPVNLDSVDDTEAKQKALSVSGITKEMLKDQPLVETVIKNFITHIKTFCGKSKAAPCGFNIENFDLPLYNRLFRQFKVADKHGDNPSFLTSLILDTKQDCNRFFYNSNHISHISFDTIRKLMGMSFKGAHRALFDVSQEAYLVVKFLRLYQNIRSKIQFSNCAIEGGGFIDGIL